VHKRLREIEILSEKIEYLMKEYMPKCGISGDDFANEKSINAWLEKKEIEKDLSLISKDKIIEGRRTRGPKHFQKRSPSLAMIPKATGKKHRLLDDEDEDEGEGGSGGENEDESSDEDESSGYDDEDEDEEDFEDQEIFVTLDSQ
jgi:hypothetical protein